MHNCFVLSFSVVLLVSVVCTPVFGINIHIHSHLCTVFRVYNFPTTYNIQLDYQNRAQGGGLRTYIVTCPKSWEGICQIADANAQAPPDGVTPDPGCGFLGNLTQAEMYYNEETDTCGFNQVDFISKGCDFNISFWGEQDDDDLWLLRFSFTNPADGSLIVNEDVPRHTTRNPTC